MYVYIYIYIYTWLRGTTAIAAAPRPRGPADLPPVPWAGLPRPRWLPGHTVPGLLASLAPSWPPASCFLDASLLHCSGLSVLPPHCPPHCPPRCPPRCPAFTGGKQGDPDPNRNSLTEDDAATEEWNPLCVDVACPFEELCSGLGSLCLLPILASARSSTLASRRCEAACRLRFEFPEGS